MRSHAKTIAAVVGITALAVVGLDTYTYAGTGDSLILGKLNKSNQTTHIRSTGNGPALSLHAKGGRPALKVDSKAKVVKLNADRVDGRSAQQLQNNVRVYTAASGNSVNGGMAFQLPKFPKGRYLATYNVTMLGAAGTPANPVSAICTFSHRSDLKTSVATSTTTSSYVGYSASLSGTGVIIKDSRNWILVCNAEAAGVQPEWTIPSFEPVRVTLTRIDKAIRASLDTARASAVPNSSPAH